MLILTRRQNESVMIGDDIVVTVLEVSPSSKQVRLGFDAPDDVSIDRSEVRDRKLAETGN